MELQGYDLLCWDHRNMMGLLPLLENYNVWIWDFEKELARSTRMDNFPLCERAAGVQGALSGDG